MVLALMHLEVTMKANYKENGNASKDGIYRIINLINGRVYFGSCKSFKRRFLGHRNSLENNKHSNKFLQNDFNKCGSDAFIFEVLEVTTGTKEERLKREQFYIDQYYDSQQQCYNLRKDACDTREGRSANDPINPLTDLRCQPHDETHKQKIGEANKEAWQDESLRAQASIDANKRWKTEEYPEYQLTNITTGETVLINSSLREWCISRNLNYKAIHLLVKGKVKISNGWYMGTEKPVYVDRAGEKRKPMSIEQRNAKSNGKYEGKKLVNDSGEILVVEKNVKEQCRLLNLHYTTFLKVLNGSCGSVGGWKTF